MVSDQRQRRSHQRRERDFMKCIIIHVIFLFSIVGCTASDELNQLKALKEDCRYYKAKYMEIEAKVPPEKITEKMNECKLQGWW